jgi:DNA replication protein DnaC
VPERTKNLEASWDTFTAPLSARTPTGRATRRNSQLEAGELSRAATKTRLAAALTPHLHPHVLTIDEPGYLSLAADAANVLCRVINDRYLQRRPILLTTTSRWRPWATWCMMAASPKRSWIASLSGGAHFALRGRSYRTRHLPEEDQPTRRKSA